MVRSIAIIGAGPSGCALACFLQQRGVTTTVYDNDKTPSLLVGESLVPAAIPILQRLGIEERVAAVSRIKRGAALRHAEDSRVDFEFQKFGRRYPDYSYNVPRPEFDRIIKARAKELGVNFVNLKAKLETVEENDETTLRLSAESLLAAGLSRDKHPDLLVDATGRARLFSRLLSISARRGPRDDVAYFAHYEDFTCDSALHGQVVLSALKCGWSWQIPLRSATSVGVVLNKSTVKEYGATPEERLEAVIEHNDVLRRAGQGRTRVSKVMAYSNYQLVSDRAHGNGWVLLGDALGFVDPMLSPGVFMALESAVLLDRAIARASDSQPSIASSNQPSMQQSCAQYYSQMRDWHDAWSRLINYFYDGRILSMGKMRDHIRQQSTFWSISRYAEPLVSRVLSQLVSGVGTRSDFNHAVLHHTTQALIKDKTCLQKYQISSALSPTHLAELKQQNEAKDRHQRQLA